jgi:hypothetical protein
MRLHFGATTFDTNGLGYAPYFLQKDGYQIYALLEAAGLATVEASYRSAKRGDAVALSRIVSNLRPKLNVLSDEDLALIRMEEPLFAEWRDVVGGSLEALRSSERDIGKARPELAIEELRDRR